MIQLCGKAPAWQPQDPEFDSLYQEKKKPWGKNNPTSTKTAYCCTLYPAYMASVPKRKAEEKGKGDKAKAKEQQRRRPARSSSKADPAYLKGSWMEGREGAQNKKGKSWCYFLTLQKREIHSQTRNRKQKVLEKPNELCAFLVTVLLVIVQFEVLFNGVL